jgi:uncharacterized protein YgiM (DUF1202 family)
MSKKLGLLLNKISTICSSVFLIFAFLTQGFADEHFPFLAEVSKESVNVRAGPNTNFEKIDKLNKGTQVVVLGRSYEWLKVQALPTTKAYIRSDYLKINQGEGLAVVLGDNVNIRSAANSTAASLGELKKGTIVKVLEQAEGWCRLQPVAGTAAWIHQDFLKEISSDVPASMLIPVIQWPSRTTNYIIEKKVIERVSLQGTLQLLTQSKDADVHYEIAIDNKSIYYLQDIPQISYFANMVVAVEGTVIPDPQKKFSHPLLHVNKITLVI